MAEQPIICDRKPMALEVEAGTHWWCSCGRSTHQPFCDGSHKGSSFAPKKFTAEKSGDAWLCQCKQTKNAPYCDGSHKGL